MWSTILTRFAAVVIGFGLAALSAHAQTVTAPPRFALPSPLLAGCADAAGLPHEAVRCPAVPQQFGS